MEADFQSLCDFNGQLVSLADAIDLKIDSLDFILLRMRKMYEQNNEISQVCKAEEDLKKIKQSLLILADAVEKVSYRYMRCEKKILLRAEKNRIDERLLLLRCDTDSYANVFLKKNSIHIFVDKQNV